MCRPGCFVIFPTISFSRKPRTVNGTCSSIWIIGSLHLSDRHPNLQTWSRKVVVWPWASGLSIRMLLIFNNLYSVEGLECIGIVVENSQWSIKDHFEKPLSNGSNHIRGSNWWNIVMLWLYLIIWNALMYLPIWMIWIPKFSPGWYESLGESTSLHGVG